MFFKHIDKYEIKYNLLFFLNFNNLFFLCGYFLIVYIIKINVKYSLIKFKVEYYTKLK